MLDFGALPPEINSGRMYSGPGPGPLLAAAAAWDALAGQTELFATSYSSMVADLQDKGWSGPSSAAMAAAVKPYVTWALATSAKAERAAGQARVATAAFEAAFAATVPPAQVWLNRHQLAVLVATNFFGLNAPAIAATEALYAEMWAQDATAMYGYAASASAAASLSSFDDPPATTNPAGQAAAATDAGGSVAGHSPAVLTQLMAAVPQQLSQLASGSVANATTAEASASASGSATSSATTASVLTAFSTLNTLDGPLTVAYQIPYTVFSGGSYYNGLVQSKIQAKDLPKIAAEDALPTGASKASAVTPGTGAVIATAGSAEPVSTLSVPQNWATAISDSAPVVEPIAEPVTRVLPPWTTNPAAPATALPPATPVGTPGIANSSGHNKSNAVFRMRDRRYRIPRPAAGG